MTRPRPDYFRGDYKRPSTLNNHGDLNIFEALFIITELANLTRPLGPPQTPEWNRWREAFVRNLRSAIEQFEHARCAGNDG